MHVSLEAAGDSVNRELAYACVPCLAENCCGRRLRGEDARQEDRAGNYHFDQRMPGAAGAHRRSGGGIVGKTVAHRGNGKGIASAVVTALLRSYQLQRGSPDVVAGLRPPGAVSLTNTPQMRPGASMCVAIAAQPPVSGCVSVTVTPGEGA